MSSSANQIKNVSQLKLHLQNIIGNIKVLEELESAAVAGTGENLMQTDVVQLISRQTSDLLHQLEEQTKKEESLLRRIKIRKNKRKINKLNKIKNKKQPKIKEPTKAPNATNNCQKYSGPHTQPSCSVPPAAASRPHHQLRNQHAAQCQLRSLELLKMLHAARGQDVAATRRFAAELSGLRTVWNSILQENTAQRTHALKIEQQWSEAYFGSSVQTYYGVKLKMSEFLNRRHTWDSYLTRSSKHGSVIPSGWVLPNAEVDAAWLQYIRK